MPQATMAACPKCGAKVRKEKLRRHLNTVHGDAPRAPREPRTADARGAKASAVKFPVVGVVALAVVAGVVLAGYWLIAAQPGGGGGPPSSGGTKTVLMQTNHGTITILIDLDAAPVTGGHFLDLVRAGSYNGNAFHRVAITNGVPFVIQGGAVSGASNVAWERTGLRNVKYSIAMARSGDANSASSKDTATSQFFINLNDNPQLDGYTYPYVVFGRVTAGQAAVDTIGSLYPSGQTTYDGAPTSPATIIQVTIP